MVLGMDTFIFVASLVASGAGCLVLLSCLAGRRSELVKHLKHERELAQAAQARQAHNVEDEPAEGEVAT